MPFVMTDQLWPGFEKTLLILYYMLIGVKKAAMGELMSTRLNQSLILIMQFSQKVSEIARIDILAAICLHFHVKLTVNSCLAEQEWSN